MATAGTAPTVGGGRAVLADDRTAACGGRSRRGSRCSGRCRSGRRSRAAARGRLVHTAMSAAGSTPRVRGGGPVVANHGAAAAGGRGARGRRCCRRRACRRGRAGRAATGGAAAGGGGLVHSAMTAAGAAPAVRRGGAVVADHRRARGALRRRDRGRGEQRSSEHRAQGEAVESCFREIHCSYPFRASAQVPRRQNTPITPSGGTSPGRSTLGPKLSEDPTR
jgi:hypothetical protein